MVNQAYLSEPTAMRYGFLSARTAGLLQTCVESDSNLELPPYMREGAEALVAGILDAQRFYNSKDDSIAPGSDVLEIYTCALDLLVEHHELYSISSLEDLETFIDILQRSLRRLIDSDSSLATNDELTRSANFFMAFSQRMLSELNRSRDAVLGLR